MPDMKLAYVLGTFPSRTETFIQRELDELRRKGFKIIIFSLRRPAVICRQAGNLTPKHLVYYRPSLLSPAVITAQWYFMLRHPRRTLRALLQTLAASLHDPIELLKCLRNLPVAAIFARRAGHFGVEHIHAHFAYMPTDVARMMATLLNISFSFSAHARDIYLQSRAALSRKAQAAKFVSVCTSYGLDELNRRAGPLPPEKVHLIYHGLTPSEFSSSEAPTPVNGGQITERPVPPLILAVGRLQPKKGFVILIEACRILRDRHLAFRCLIVGEGSERRNLESAINRLGLAETVQLLGECSTEEVVSLLKQAHVFALPCIIAPDGDRDSLPNVILESLAAGIPVVTTPVAGIPEVIVHGRTGLLAPPGDARILAEMIEELLKSESLCRILSTFGTTTIRERFDIARNAAPLAELFNNMRKTI
ncbi:MAG: glycosyltransferase [bacterium]|jgi:glycosyltransferase involved in cell wall biosynthesis